MDAYPYSYKRYIMIVVDHIIHRLSNKLNNSCIVTGLDSSGKSTMISKLYPKFHVHKPISWDSGDWPIHGYNYEELPWYQIFDRYYPIESYVYTDCENGSKISDTIKRINLNILKNVLHKHIDKLNKCIGNPMFVFYLHNEWRGTDNRDQPWYTDNIEIQNTIKQRYLDVVDILKNWGLHMILLLPEKSIILN